MAIVGACHKGSGISTRVGIGAGSSKDVFGPSRMSLVLHRASSMVYSGGVGE